MATTIINENAFRENFAAMLNKELLAAAEPALQKAIQDAEREMRRRLGAVVVGMVEQSYSVHSLSDTLHIQVHMTGKKSGI